VQEDKRRRSLAAVNDRIKRRVALARAAGDREEHDHRSYTLRSPAL
jgi:hypothetical protein